MKKVYLFILLFLCITHAYGQKRDVVNSIPQKFLEFCSNFPREEIFIHTDRDFYIAGENIWFSVYLAERKTSLSSSNSSIAYLEILNFDNRPVIRKRVKLENGCGEGQVVLPDTLSSGIYTIRAYTNWMKNFLPDNCFIKKLSVYNAVSSQAYLKKPLAENYPEPGPQALSGSKGFNLTINNLKTGILEISINTDNSFRAGNSSVYGFIRTYGAINYSETVLLEGENTVKRIPKSVLSAGINHITFFDGSGKPLAERFIYTPVSSGAVMVINSPEKIGRREKVTLDIAFQNMPDSAFSTLSLSVAPAAGNGSIDIDDYMVFGSEFGQEILEKLRGRRLEEISPAIIDSMLVNVRSNWIDWNTILSGRLSVDYQLETQDHYITGKLVNQTEPGKMVLLSIPGKKAVFQYARTADDGSFSFSIPINEEMNDLVIQPDDISEKAVVKMGSSFSEDYPPAGHTIDTSRLPSYFEKWSVNYQVQKIYGISYSLSTIKQFPFLSTQRFYGKPDIELILDDYIKLPVMEEIFFEILPGANLKKRKTGYEITIADPITNQIYDFPPSLFVDGVRIDDAGIIANLDPEYVEQIDVVKEKYIVGDYLFTGLINVITKAGDFSSVNLPDYAVRTFYRVVDPITTFSSPDYSAPGQKQIRIPDFRNTIFWDPSVNEMSGKKSIAEFWSSDSLAEYEIIIQGVTSGGEFVSARKLIKAGLQPSH